MSRTLELARKYYGNLVSELKEPPAWARDETAERIRDIRSDSARVTRLLGKAQQFHLDEDADRMLSEMLHEMGDGVFEMFKDAHLPFPVVWIERKVPEASQKQGALIAQKNGETAVRFMTRDGGNFSPSLNRMVYKSEGGQHFPTPHYRQALATCSPFDTDHFKEAKVEHEELSIMFFGVCMAMSTMLSHPGMLEATGAKGARRTSRSRRDHKEAATNLPATRVQHLTLGELGRAQLEAMEAPSGERGRRRAHWVRGHFMRNRGGGVSWRVPHIRGVGPLIGQDRKVTASEMYQAPTSQDSGDGPSV